MSKIIKAMFAAALLLTNSRMTAVTAEELEPDEIIQNSDEYKSSESEETAGFDALFESNTPDMQDEYESDVCPDDESDGNNMSGIEPDENDEDLTNPIPSDEDLQKYDIKTREDVLVQTDEEPDELTETKEVFLRNEEMPAKTKVAVLKSRWIPDDVAAPSCVTVHVIGSDGSEREFILSAGENWSKKIQLPAYDVSDNEIVYSAYETPSEGYETNATQTAPVTLNSIIRDNPEMFTTYEHDRGYSTRKVGFADVPTPDYAIINENDFSLGDAVISGMPDSIALGQSVLRYTGASATGSPDTYPYALYYHGNTNASGVEVPITEPFTLTWPDRAVAFDGETYDVRLSIEYLKVITAGAGSATRDVIFMNNGGVGTGNEGKLNLSALRGLSKGTNAQNGTFGTKIQVKVEIVDKTGTPMHGTLISTFNDIDQEDNVRRYREDISDIADLYNNRPWQEAVEPINGVLSPIYLTKNTYIEWNSAKNRFYGSADVAAGKKQGTMSYVADSSGASFVWTGSLCVTSLFSPSENYVDPTTYTNTFTNTKKHGSAEPIVTKVIEGSSPVERDWDFTLTPVSGNVGGSEVAVDEIPMPLETTEITEPAGEPTLDAYLAVKTETADGTIYLSEYEYNTAGTVDLEARFYYTNLIPGDHYRITYLTPSGGYAGPLKYIDFVPEKPNGYASAEYEIPAYEHEAGTFNCFIGGAEMYRQVYDETEQVYVSSGESLADFAGIPAAGDHSVYVIPASGGVLLLNTRDFPTADNTAQVRQESVTVTVHHQGSGSFGQITFDRTGTFVYNVTEDSGYSDYQNDESVIQLTYTVTDEGGDTLTVTPSYTRVKDGSQEAASGITFVNRYLSPEMTISKTWIGDDAADRPESVTLHIKGSDGSAYTKTLSAPDWTDTFDVHSEAGEIEVIYKVWEDEVDHYESSAGSEAVAVTAVYDASTRSYSASISNELMSDFPTSKAVRDSSGKDIHQKTVLVNSDLYYYITVENPLSSARRFTVEDEIPQYTSFVSADSNGIHTDGKVTWTVDIPAGESKVVGFVVTAAAANVRIDNQAVVTMLKADNTTPAVRKQTNIVTNYTTTEGDAIRKYVKNAAGADINNKMVENQSILYYELEVTNTADIGKIYVVEDTIPANSVYVDGSADNGGTFADGKVTWTFDIEAGETRTLKFRVKANGEGVRIRNEGVLYVDDLTLYSNPVENSTPIRPVKEVCDNKTVDMDGRFVESGDVLTYRITVTNPAAEGKTFTVTDVLPDGVTFVSANNGGINTDGTVTWTVDVEGGSTQVLSITVIVDGTASEMKNSVTQIVDGITLISNEVSTYRAVIVINKAINNYYAEFGEPAFIYHIYDSHNHHWVRAIEVTNHENGMVTFEVPKGVESETYTVFEEINGRYKFVSLASPSPNVSIVGGESDKAAIVAIDSVDRTATLNFVNEIKRWDQLSHSSTIINHISD
ncbi:MAG: DUF11 domain-containing protein [Oscillospiraceae bacterium]|nr:DUF11 domain-containing protein [Oscillospiraceae bacterium]